MSSHRNERFRSSVGSYWDILQMYILEDEFMFYFPRISPNCTSQLFWMNWERGLFAPIYRKIVWIYMHPVIKFNAIEPRLFCSEICEEHVKSYSRIKCIIPLESYIQCTCTCNLPDYHKQFKMCTIKKLCNFHRFHS